MVAVVYIEDGGERHAVDVPEGDTLMQGAVNHMVPGIVGECGGALACATCHCYVDEAWLAATGTPSPTERDMLESAASPVLPNSRLGCQIAVSAALDGIVVRLPASQY